MQQRAVVQQRTSHKHGRAVAAEENTAACLQPFPTPQPCALPPDLHAVLLYPPLRHYRLHAQPLLHQCLIHRHLCRLYVLQAGTGGDPVCC